MEQLVTSDFKLGIIAGGQLGKMLLLAASNWDIKTYVLDKDAHCPASTCCHKLVIGNQDNFEDVYRFGQQVDMLTFEVEHINIEALKKLKQEGKRIFPDPAAMEIIQDKGIQKQFFKDRGIPSAPFSLHANKLEVTDAVDSGQIRIPFVQKLRTGGFDGRGVSVVRAHSDLDKLLDGPCLIENLVDISKEISVIAARNARGQIRCFPTVDMDFNAGANLVERLVCPSSCDEATQERARSLAEKIIEALDFVGILALEFFVDTSGAVWLNEMAPRPHNSGHHTIESHVTSQYEQHLRAIFNFSLGSTALKLPSVMINLLGEEGFEGKVKYLGFTDCMAIDGVKIHLYGKKITRPFRKMGHVTILAKSLEEALQKAQEVKNKIKVIAW
jgi:5-(carboxyamino)imidazole ribonucleotide synthase